MQPRGDDEPQRNTTVANVPTLNADRLDQLGAAQDSSVTVGDSPRRPPRAPHRENSATANVDAGSGRDAPYVVAGGAPYEGASPGAAGLVRDGSIRADARDVELQLEESMAPRGRHEGRRRTRFAIPDDETSQTVDDDGAGGIDGSGVGASLFSREGDQNVLRFDDDDDHSPMIGMTPTTGTEPIPAAGQSTEYTTGAGGNLASPQEALAGVADSPAGGAGAAAAGSVGVSGVASPAEGLDAAAPRTYTDPVAEAVAAQLSDTLRPSAVPQHPLHPQLSIDVPAPQHRNGGTSAPASQRGHRSQVMRMKHAAFAQLTMREGKRYMAVEQSGTSTPVLRDFPTLKAMLAYLSTQASRFRSLTPFDSDDEEMDAHAMERALNRNLHGRSFSSSSSDTDTADTRAHRRRLARSRSGIHQSQPRGSHGHDGATSSSSSSSSSTMSGLLPAQTMWIDVQTPDTEEIEELLQIFPRLDRDTIDDLLQHDGVDTAHWFASSRYLFANMECVVPTDLRASFTMPPGPTPAGFDPSTLGTTIVSLVAFSDVCVTVHAKPFAGHRGMLQSLHGLISRRRRAVGHPGSPRGAGAPSTTPLVPQHTANINAQHALRKRPRLTIGIIVATLIENVVMGTLPDPTACLSEVDRIDEMVLLVKNDSHDLLRRIARVRRILSMHRSSLFRKERFLQQFTSPALRATFISGFTAEQYRHTLGEVQHTAERLEAARDVLTQANSNFVSHISLQMTQVSNNMNKKMKALSQVATICLPLNIITGMFGMNVQVPFSAEKTDSLAPFFTIVAGMLLFLFVGIPCIYRTMHDEDAKNSMAVELGDD